MGRLTSVAPVLGSQLLLVMNWRGIFWVLAAYGAVVILAVALWIVETLPVAERHVAGHSTLGQRYRAVLSDKVFVGVAIVGAMTFTGLSGKPAACPARGARRQAPTSKAWRIFTFTHSAGIFGSHYGRIVLAVLGLLKAFSGVLVLLAPLDAINPIRIGRA